MTGKYNRPYSIVGRLLFLLVFLGICSYAGAQGDNSFLDDSFTAESDSQTDGENGQFLDDEFTGDEMEGEDAPPVQEQDIAIPAAVLPSSLSFMKFQLTETVSYGTFRDDSTLNPSEIFYSAPWKNDLLLNTNLQYKNKDRYLTLGVDFNLHLFGAVTDDTDFGKPGFADTLDTNMAFELREGYVRFSLLDNALSFSLGKLLRSFGSGYFMNPGNPLLRKTGDRLAMAKNLKIKDLTTSGAYDLIQERGSGDEIGYWAIEVELNLFPITWQAAYLPLLETGFAEFDRPEHSVLSTLRLYTWDSVTPSLLFYAYGDKVFVSADVSMGIGEEITLHSEGAVSFENELPYLRETTPEYGYQNYTLTQNEKDGVHPSGLLGLTYTPRIDFQSIATFYLEFYYNGKGLWDDDWNEQLALHEDIYSAYNSLLEAAEPLKSLSSAYSGFLNGVRNYYNPLDQRPLYLFFRVSRDNLFSDIWENHLNLESNLIYSILDTSFLWTTKTELVTQELLSFGFAFRYAFGQPKGAFTLLTEVFSLSVFCGLQW